KSRVSREVHSATRRSVPWRLSMNGETTASRGFEEGISGQGVTLIVSHQRCRTKSDHTRDHPTRPGCARKRLHTLCTAAGLSTPVAFKRSALNVSVTVDRRSSASHRANGNEKVRFGRVA